MSINLQQIQSDFKNETIVCRATMVAAIDYAVKLEAQNARIKKFIDEWKIGTENRESETGYVRGSSFAFVKCADDLKAIFNATMFKL